MQDDDTKPFLSYKVGVRVGGKPGFQFNALRFADPSEAAEYSRALRLRWPAVVETLVQGSVDKPNATFPVPSDRYPVEREPR